MSVPEMVTEPKDTYLSDPDNQLMQKAGSGNIAAFKELIKKHQGTVTGIIYRYTGNHNEVEDLAQDIFLKIYKAADSYVPRAQFKTWLYKVVANHCLNFFRSQKRKAFITSLDQSVSEDQNPHIQRTDAQKEQPEILLQQQELQTALKKALSELPERQRMAIILHRFEGLSYKEVADTLGSSLSAVESLIFRAMNNLKETLSP
ncbi:MAG: RNA polymerase sigma factor, partial [Thermodesulfobacteriota bacterium]|nr:RNA polymerase sigma factor [Thermodesulfobacteriota bacterium]